jgi:hypothetical protein
MPSSLTKELEINGIVVLPDLLGADRLASMRAAFAARLRRQRWNDVDGYEKTEPYRHLIQDVLTLDQGFIDLALHPNVKQALSDYLGEQYALVEAKGWLSLPTRRDFHGWHGDAWYDQERVRDGIPREVKLGLYLSDVRSGAFKYIRGTHGQQAPRNVRPIELAHWPTHKIVEVQGAAGTAFLFDTSGIHRQAVPILEPRQAVFYCYHDPRVPLQAEDVAYYRYHPLLLNAAFLGGLTPEDQRLLGFGNKTNFLPAFERGTEHTVFQALMQSCFNAKLRLDEFRRRLVGRLRRPLHRP